MPSTPITLCALPDQSHTHTVASREPADLTRLEWVISIILCFRPWRYLWFPPEAGYILKQSRVQSTRDLQGCSLMGQNINQGTATSRDIAKLAIIHSRLDCLMTSAVWSLQSAVCGLHLLFLDHNRPNREFPAELNPNGMSKRNAVYRSEPLLN